MCDVTGNRRDKGLKGETKNSLALAIPVACERVVGQDVFNCLCWGTFFPLHGAP